MLKAIKPQLVERQEQLLAATPHCQLCGSRGTGELCSFLAKAIQPPSVGLLTRVSLQTSWRSCRLQAVHHCAGVARPPGCSWLVLPSGAICSGPAGGAP